MGLDYSIRTYIKKEKLSASLKWLFENSSNDGGEPLQIRSNNETTPVSGHFFKVERRPPVTGNTIIDNFTVLSFTTSLIFDIDPKVIASIANNAMLYDQPFSWLEDFKERFEQLYLKNGKISIGGFDTTITKMENNDVYEMVFMAVTSNMSWMIAKSIAVKKWIVDFSEASDAIFSYVDMEDSGRNVYYYKGRLNLTLHTNYDTHRYPAFATFFEDYRALYEKSEKPSETTYVREHVKSYIKQELLPACIQWLLNNTRSEGTASFPVPDSGETVYIKGASIKPEWDLPYDMDISLTKLRDSNTYEITFTPVSSGSISWQIEKSLTVRKWMLEFSIHADVILTFLDQVYSGHRILYYKGQQLDFMIHDPEEICSSAVIDGFFTDCYALERKDDI